MPRLATKFIVLIVGEKITVLDSNAVAMVVEKPNVTRLGIVFLNQNRFNIVTFWHYLMTLPP